MYNHKYDTIALRQVFLLEKKIVKVGNSLGVVIPYTILDEMGLSHKDSVELEYNPTLKVITLRNKTTTLPEDHLEQVIRNVVVKILNEKGL